jgi:prepilin-type processing-associated H-X9-DG protein
LEEGNVYTVGKGLTEAQKKIELQKQVGHVIPTFNCPSRRPPRAMQAWEWAFNVDLDENTKHARTDYAINGGTNRTGTGPGPTLSCFRRYPDWGVTNSCAFLSDDRTISLRFDGISTDHTGARLAQIADGTSKTILAGEKYVDIRYYDFEQQGEQNVNQPNQGDPGDNNSLYQGYDFDQTRWPATNQLPLQDAAERHEHNFGSAHTGAMNLVFCDGSVQSVDYDIDPDVWHEMGRRGPPAARQ